MGRTDVTAALGRVERGEAGAPEAETLRQALTQLQIRVVWLEGRLAELVVMASVDEWVGRG